ncbi:hypothetical protein [Nocardia sp. NPDC050406]|uniref:hypothetical protein n=1 Tax=Nocardia sp. NPDC050406 TaxID=3364318 RepID=UPI0037A9087D
MNDIFPLLKPADWEHRDLVVHDRFGFGEDALVVAYARDGDGNFEIITQGSPEAGDPEGLRRLAFGNLARQRYPFEVAEAGGLPFATASGHDFAAEKVLDPATVLEAQRLLGTDSIQIAVPRRTCLMAFPQDLTADQVQTMIKLVMYTYLDDSYGNAPITPSLFLFDQGELVGFGRIGG